MAMPSSLGSTTTRGSSWPVSFWRRFHHDANPSASVVLSSDSMGREWGTSPVPVPAATSLSSPCATAHVGSAASVARTRSTPRS